MVRPQVVIFLYLLDNDTSFVILASTFVGILIEFWKVRLRFCVRTNCGLAMQATRCASGHALLLRQIRVLHAGSSPVVVCREVDEVNTGTKRLCCVC